MKRVLLLMLVITTVAAARDKKPKAQPGPYVFTSKASAQTLKVMIVQENLRFGYTLDAPTNSSSSASRSQLRCHLSNRFSWPQVPVRI